MAYKRFRTAGLIASSPKDAIDKRVVRLFENMTGQRECVDGTIRGEKGRLIVWLNRWESETVEVYRL